jgi:hypothetical protein
VEKTTFTIAQQVQPEQNTNIEPTCRAARQARKAALVELGQGALASGNTDLVWSVTLLVMEGYADA